MKKDISRTMQTKNGNTWTDGATWTDPALVYESLTHDLIAKKINKCSYIKTISRRQNYNGTATITVTYTDNVRALYVIADH